MKQLLITIAAVVLVGCVSNMSIYEAAKKGNIKLVKQHLAAGTDVNAKDDRGWTPLFEAVINGHKEIVELLIANGADVNAKNKTKFIFIKNQARLYINNPTSLDWAIVSKQTEIADLLRRRGGKKSEVFEAAGN